MESEKTIISIRDVKKVFTGRRAHAVTALDGVSLDIARNEFFTLLGPSGCGKTTLLRILAGFENPTAGRVALEGEDISHVPPHKRPINTVFQNYALFPHLNVAQNIAFGLEMRGIAKSSVDETVQEMLTLVRLEGFEHRHPANLSGGQQQRVALARALANRPKVLLLDEPLSALDLKLRREMQLELKRIQYGTGITFIFVTHDQEEALAMSDRIAVMNEGKVLQVGSPHTIYDRPSHRFVADFIGETNFLEGELKAFKAGEAKIKIAGKLFKASAPDGKPSKTAAIAIRPERLRLTKGGKQASGLAASVQSISYFGTDTVYHVQLKDGTPVRVRVQNIEPGINGFNEGDAVSVVIPETGLQVMAS